jgi:hypothetical protein
MMADKLAGFILVIPALYLCLYLVAWRLVRRKFP